MKQRKKKKSGLNAFIDEYNNRETKNNVQNTLLKSLVDVAGMTAGTGLGALSGKNSKFVGLATIIGGHYLGDKSNVLRIIGASTIAYGVGKAKDFENNPDMDTPQKRMSDWKDNWLETLYIKMKKEQSKSEKEDSKVEIEEIIPEPKSEKQNENIKFDEEDDLSGLDIFEHQIEASARAFESENSNLNFEPEEVEKDLEESEFDNPDFSTM